MMRTSSVGTGGSAPWRWPFPDRWVNNAWHSLFYTTHILRSVFTQISAHRCIAFLINGLRIFVATLQPHNILGPPYYSYIINSSVVVSSWIIFLISLCRFFMSNLYCNMLLCINHKAIQYKDSLAYIKYNNLLLLSHLKTNTRPNLN